MLIEKIHLEEDEKILLSVRKHWFILFAEIFGIVLLAFIPIGAAFFLYGSESGLALTGEIDGFGRIFVFFSTAWILILSMILAHAWTDYYLDIWFVTSKRVIAIDQRGLFHRNIASFRLERLQDLNIKVNGIIATLLHFGTLEAETAGQSDDPNEFRFKGAPNPRQIKALILKAADDLRNQSSSYPGASVDAAL